MERPMQQEIKQARSRFVAMAVTYFLGVFNDNFFKQAVLLLAVGAGMSGLQGRATELFSLPFILFSAWGGWLADRFTKKRVVIGVKFLELAAMLIGAYGILTLNWNCVLSMVFLMGLQSTLFGPALNGSIPELYPAEYVTTANSVLKLVTTVAILLGMALAGFALDLQLGRIIAEFPFGSLVVAVSVAAIALLGVLASFGVYSRPATGGKIPFPWTGPLQSIRELSALRTDRLLLLAVCCDSFFYFISLLAVLVINTLGLQQLSLSKSATSILSVSLMVGVCIGAFTASRLTTDKRWTHVLGPGALGMGICLATAGLLVQGMSLVPFWLLLTLLTGAGFFGGLFLIPVTSFIQIRPVIDSKGRTIAASNFLAFSGMWCSGRLFTIMNGRLQPSVSMVVLGIVAAVVSVVLFFLLFKDGATQD
jgi:acyl-[acyl-carrier-protein]-phospholipid O-acyltransferase/long-chain-fatty-acid--[acyl-carrier-protein] ligase